MDKKYVIYKDILQYYQGRYWSNEIWTKDLKNAMLFDSEKELIEYVMMDEDEDRQVWEEFNESTHIIEIRTVFLTVP